MKVGIYILALLLVGERVHAEQAAAIISGLAGAAAAGAQIAIAGIQSRADVIMTDRAATAHENIAADTNDTIEHIADRESDRAHDALATARYLNHSNQEAQTERARMQNETILRAQDMELERFREKNAYDWAYKSLEIAEKYKEIEAQRKANEAKLNADMVKAGIATGIVATNSATGLNVKRPQSRAMILDGAIGLNPNPTAPMAKPLGGYLSPLGRGSTATSKQRLVASSVPVTTPKLEGRAHGAIGRHGVALDGSQEMQTHRIR